MVATDAIDSFSFSQSCSVRRRRRTGRRTNFLFLFLELTRARPQRESKVTGAIAISDHSTVSVAAVCYSIGETCDATRESMLLSPCQHGRICQQKISK